MIESSLLRRQFFHAFLSAVFKVRFLRYRRCCFYSARAIVFITFDFIKVHLGFSVYHRCWRETKTRVKHAHSVREIAGISKLFSIIFNSSRRSLRHRWKQCASFHCMRFLRVRECFAEQLYLQILLRFSQTCELWSSKAAFAIAFFASVNHNYDHKQRTLKHRNTQNGSKFTNQKSQTLTFWTR